MSSEEIPIEIVQRKVLEFENFVHNKLEPDLKVPFSHYVFLVPCQQILTIAAFLLPMFMH